MATKRLRNDFINFVMEADKKPKLMGEFMSQNTAKDLHSFFQKKGFKDIPYNDCQDILTAKKGMILRRLPRPNKKARVPVPPSDCPTGQQAY